MSDPTEQPDQYDGMGGSYLVGPDGVRVLVERTGWQGPGESDTVAPAIEESPSSITMQE